MKSGQNFTNVSSDFEKENKMEIENFHDKNHSDMVKQFTNSRRTMAPYQYKNNLNPNNNKNNSLPSNIYGLNSDIIKNMDEVMILLNNISSKKPIKNFKIEVDDLEPTKNKLLENLKKIRKELSKENIPVTNVKNILNNNVQNFIEALIELFKNKGDNNLQLESLWIINNLIFFISKYSNEIIFDANKITNLLINYLIKIQNEESNKYFLIEKIIRIFGNLININYHTVLLLINNKIVDSIINYLNNPVSNFRISCLWLINKLLISLGKNNSLDYIKYFINKDAIMNYKSIFNRIKKNYQIDEMCEFFWVISELVKHNSSILITIFFPNVTDIYYFLNNNNLKNDYVIKNFCFILDNSLTNKMTQISFRLISDILVICNSEIKNEYLLNKLIECLFERKTILLYINDVLNSPKNKYDISLVKDVLLLIFNLICLSPTKSSIFFKKGIVNLISDRDYQTNREVMKLLYKIFYRIIVNSSFSFEPNDEKVIRACLTVIKRFKEDEFVLILFIDILYLYLRASKTNIDNNVENELGLLRNEQNPNIGKYLDIFLNLANIVKMSSPLSKIMRNI